MPDSATIQALEHKAAQMRYQILRMMGANKTHHFGGSLSATDLVAALYFHKMNHRPSDPKWPDRDRFIMSKGHSVPAQYAALALLDIIPLEELPTLKLLGSRLQGHPAMHWTPGLEGCTGSLGQGLSYGNGMALAAMITGRHYHVYCLIGDGELDEGQNWEAAKTAATECLHNVTAIVDLNGLKAMNQTKCGRPLGPLGERWEAFGWAVKEIDGHDMGEICEALDWATGITDRPQVIIARTVKGKGVSFIENQAGFHNAPVTEEQAAQAMSEIKATLAKWEGGAA